MAKDPDGKGLQALISDNVQRRLIADPAAHILATMEAEHLEVHHGDTRRVATFANIAAGAFYSWFLITPNSAVRIHLFFDVTVEAETEIEIRKEAELLGGAAMPLNNRDLNESPGAALVVNSTATVLNPGVVLWKFKLGSGKKSGGGTRPANEIILKQNEVYLFRMKNTSASPGWISPEFNWYEITPKD